MATKFCLLLLLSGYIRAEDYVHHPIRYQSITDRGTYNFGYDTGLFGAHSSHKEQKDENGIVRGKYSYTDPNGRLRTVVYEAGPFGFRAKGDVGPDRYPLQELPAQSSSGDTNATTLQSEGTHHIEYNLRAPSGVAEHYLQAASSHPNRETKGYTYDAATHPDVSDRLFVPQSSQPKPNLQPPDLVPDASVHPNRETKGYTYDAATHPDVRDRLFVPQSSQPKPHLQPPDLVPDASVHPNRETKGYTYDAATHPDVRDRLFVPQSSQPKPHLQPPDLVPDASVHPNRETKGYTYDAATHPDVRDRLFVPQSSQPKPKLQPPDLVPDASVHPNRETKGYTYDAATHPDVRDRLFVPQSSQPKPKLQPPDLVPAASFHPNSEMKGYTYDAAKHPDVRDRTFVPQSSQPKPKLQPPDLVSAASSHPNRETKGYTYDAATHPDVRSRLYVPESSHPRQRVQPPVSDSSPRIPAASSHPRRETKGYTYNPASHPDVRDRLYVPESSQPRQKVQPPVSDPSPPVPSASSHPNRRTKGYVYDPSTQPDLTGRIYVPGSSQRRPDIIPPPSPPSHLPSPPPSPPRRVSPPPPPAPHVPAASSHPNRETKGYTYDPATHPNVQGRLYVPLSSRQQTRVHVSPSHSHRHRNDYIVGRPSSAGSEIVAVSRASSVSVARSADRPVYTKSYVGGPSRGHGTGSRDYIRSSGSSRVVKTTGLKRSGNVPQYMSAEEYLRRYRSG